MTRMQIQIDAAEFWPSLQEDIRSAREYVYLQTLSFEGDRVGKDLAAELSACKAPDRRVVVDEFYTIHRINDHFLHNPKRWFGGHSEFLAERDETLAMLGRLEADGVGVKLTNPSGPLVSSFLRRNHKKMVVIDNRIAYIGGINFTEHNFEWHDMMLRIEDPELTEFLRDDFLETWQGNHGNTSRKFGDDIELFRFDGRTNRRAFQPIIDIISSARKSIHILSPYIAFPFYAALRKAIANGARVVLITPDNNNWVTMKKYVIWESVRAGVDLRMYPGRMSHLKAMLIDEQYLILGSSNFDFLSSEIMQEVIAVITNKNTITEFREKVLDVDLRQTVPNQEKVSHVRGLYHISQLKLMPILVGAVEKILRFGR